MAAPRSIAHSIAMGFGLVLCCLCAISGLSVFSMLRVQKVQSDHARTFLPAAKLANDFQREMLNARISLIYFVTIQKVGSRELGTKHLEAASSTLESLKTLVGTEPDLWQLRPLVAELDHDLDEYKQVLTVTLDLVARGTVSGPAYTEQVKVWAQKGGVLVGHADQAQSVAARMSNEKNERNIGSLRLTTTTNILSVFLSLCLSVGIAWYIVSTVNTSLRTIRDALQQSSQEIAASARELASSSESLAQNSSKQAATIEETSAASTEISSMATRTTANSGKTAEMVTTSQSGFEHANISLLQLKRAMDEIGSSSQKVSKIIKLIDEIAFQTNILALNAAVEAARAGESGLGFAVVADEVRSLAQRCSGAARDTNTLIEESLKKSEDGRTRMTEVTSAVQIITLESERIRQLIEEIRTGSVEQSQGIQVIDKAISQLERVTQSSAAQAEEGAAAAAELNLQAETMNDVVDRLCVLVGG